MIRNVTRLSYVLIACVAACVNVGCPGGGTPNPAAVLEGTWNASDDAGEMFVLVFNSEGRLVRIEGEAEDGQDVMVIINNATTVVDGDNVTITIPVNDAEAEFVGTLSNNDNTLTGSVSRSIEIGDDLVITIAQGDIVATRVDDGNDNDNDNGNGNGNGNDNDNDNGVGFNLTDIPIHVQGRIDVGDDLIAYTDIGENRSQGVVNYFHPSDDPVTAQGIPNAEDFDADSFAVSGTKIILSDASGERAFGLTVFDTATRMFAAIPIEDIRLVNIPSGGTYATGYIVADGNFVATRNDTDDDVVVKVVDISGATPVVIPFTMNPDGFVQQVTVDAESELVVAVANGAFHVYDINAPDAAPTVFDVSSLDGIADEIVGFDDGVLLYADDSEGIVYFLDVTDASNTPVAVTTLGRDATRFNVRGNNYGFLYQGPSSQGLTAAIGVMPSTTPNVSDGETILENSANLGRFGYGDTLAVAGSDSNPLWFLGGRDDVLTPNVIQQSTNGASWSLTPDEDDPTIFLTASDVTTNAAGDLIVFKYEIEDEQFIGFANLD